MNPTTTTTTAATRTLSRGLRRARQAVPGGFDARSVVLFTGLALGVALASHAQLGPDGRPNMPLSVTAPAPGNPAARTPPAPMAVPPGSPGTLTPPSAAAQPGLAPAPSAGAAPAGTPDVSAIFTRADADRDGRLSRTEAERLPDLARNFDRVDSNRDGAVSLAELQAAVGR